MSNMVNNGFEVAARLRSNDPGINSDVETAIKILRFQGFVEDDAPHCRLYRQVEDVVQYVDIDRSVDNGAMYFSMNRKGQIIPAGHPVMAWDFIRKHGQMPVYKQDNDDAPTMDLKRA